MVSFAPTKKGEAERVLDMLKGGGGSTTSSEAVFTQEFEVLAILKGAQ